MRVNIEKLVNTGEIIVSDCDIPQQPIIKFTNSDAAIELLSEAANRVKSSNNKRVAIHADIDFDGIASYYLMDCFTGSMVGRHKIVPAINKKRVHGIKEDLVSVINKANADINNKAIELLVIVDSSTNEIELIKQLNCDVLVIDHHDIVIDKRELCGKTAGGRYVIINNEADGIDSMSATEVIYEWMRYVASVRGDIISAEGLKNSNLASWVAVSLFSDVINTDNIRNQWFIRELYNKRIESTLETLIRSGCGALRVNKSSLTYGLVPIINASIRMGHSVELLSCIINRPSDISRFISYKSEQSKKVANITSDSNISQSMVQYGDLVIFTLTDSDDAEGFEGMIATKLQSKYSKTAIVVHDDGNVVHGSFRVSGKLSKLALREKLDEIEGFTAAGHKEAFGIKVELPEGREALNELRDAVINISTTDEVGEDHDDKDIIIDIVDLNMMQELIRSGGVAKIASINAHMADRKILIRVMNGANVKMIQNTGKMLKYDVYGITAVTFSELKQPFNYILLYPEKNDYLDIYIDKITV